MLSQLVVVTTAIAGMTLVRLIRRFESGQRGYLLVVAGALALSVGALIRADRFLSVIAVALGFLVLVMPWLLELLARLAFHRGRLSLAVAMAGLRATLMPGAGLGRQQQILAGLAVLEREGVDRALTHFRALAEGTEDASELAVIHEQIVSMLFYGQRWDEGIAHYERLFQPRYAAMRPALALGLLRAYGESGRLETAAGLLRALEEGPVGTDPRAGGLVSQARLTFLAYAGAASPVTDALTEPRRRVLGLSAASGALFRGIALWRSGQSERAAAALIAVEDLAGASDDRIVDASRAALAGLQAEPESARPELTEELLRYAERVAERLEHFLRAAPRARRRSMLIAAPLLMLGLLGGYVAVLALDRGGIGALIAGALTPELWRAGSWSRALVGTFASVDPVGLLLNVYALWLAAPLVERIFGPMRVVFTALAAATLGSALAVATMRDPGATVSGGSLAAFGVTVAALWTLLPARTPGIAARTRRGIAIPLVLVAVAQVVSLGPGWLAADVSFAGLCAAAVVGMLCVGLAPPRGWAARILAAAGVVMLGLTAVAAVKVAREDVESFAISRRTPQAVGGVSLSLPAQFAATGRRTIAGLPLPLHRGWVDQAQLRAATMVQLVPAADVPPDACALLVRHPELSRELSVIGDAPVPPGFAAAYAEVDPSGEPLRAWTLRRNGTSVALVIERTMPAPRADDPAATVTLAMVAAPPEAVEHAPRLYATLLAEAVPTAATTEPGNGPPGVSPAGT